MTRPSTYALRALAAATLCATVFGAGGAAQGQEQVLVLEDGTELAIRVEGSGPAVVLLHGGPSLGYRYMEGLLALSDTYTVVLYDQRGVGRSGNAMARAPGLQRLVEDVEEIRRALDLDSVVLVGHSWGAHLALTYALQQPGNVEALVLISPSEPGSRFMERQAAAVDARRTPADSAAFASALEAYRADEPGAVDRVYRAMYRPWFVRREAADGLVVDLTRPQVERGRATASAVAADSRGGATWQTLPRIESPTLVVHGRGDVVPLEMARELAEAIPTARLRVMDGVGHFPMIEAPTTLTRIIRDFLHPD